MPHPQPAPPDADMETAPPMPRRVPTQYAAQLAEAALGVTGGAVVYVDVTLRGPGTFVIGREAIWVDRPVLVAFRDEFPGTAWPRPCTYALIDPDTGEVRATAGSDHPPHAGTLPDGWVVAADPGRRADLIGDHRTE